MEQLTIEIHCLTVLQARSLRSRYPQSVFLLRAVKKRYGPGLSPWLVDEHLLPVSLHIVFLLCVSISLNFPF